MTRQEAIEFLQSRVDLIDKHYPQIDDCREALEIAIEAIENEEENYEIAYEHGYFKGASEARGVFE